MKLAARSGSHRQNADACLTCSGYYIWDCRLAEVSGTIGDCALPRGEEPPACYAVCWCQTLPLLVVTMATPAGSGCVSLRDTRGVAIKTSPTLQGLDASTKAVMPSPCDSFMAGLLEQGSVLVVLRIDTCGVYMEARLCSPMAAQQGAQSIFFSRDSRKLAVVQSRTLEGGEACVNMIWMADIAKGALDFARLDPCPGISGVFGFVNKGLVCTVPPADGQGPHAMHILPGDKLDLLPTKASCTICWAHSVDQVLGMHEYPVLEIDLAHSPCNTWITVMSGDGLSAWRLQIVRSDACWRVACTLWARARGCHGWLVYSVVF